jgi:hypothetical protein
MLYQFELLACMPDCLFLAYLDSLATLGDFPRTLT